MRHEMLPEINSLIQKLTELRTEFETGIICGKSYAEVKAIYLQIKELSHSLKQLEASGGKEAATN